MHRTRVSSWARGSLPVGLEAREPEPLRSFTLPSAGPLSVAPCSNLEAARGSGLELLTHGAIE
jgi:hypothetical protein